MNDLPERFVPDFVSAQILKQHATLQRLRDNRRTHRGSDYFLIPPLWLHVPEPDEYETFPLAHVFFGMFTARGGQLDAVELPVMIVLNKLAKLIP